MENISGDFTAVAGEKCKETKIPCDFMTIDDGGNVSCSSTGFDACQRFLEWKQWLDDERAAGKKITARVTEEGLKYLKKNIAYWVLKPAYQRIIGQFYTMSDKERQDHLEKLVPSEVDNAAKEN